MVNLNFMCEYAGEGCKTYMQAIKGLDDSLTREDATEQLEEICGTRCCYFQTCYSDMSEKEIPGQGSFGF